jgi:hypothetical protein
MNRQSSPGIIRIVTLGLICFLAGCSEPTVPLPGSDSTPPILSWTVIDHGTGQTHYFSQSGQLMVSLNNPIEIWFYVNDSGGVKRIALTGEGRFHCSNNGVGEMKYTDMAPQEKTLQPNAQNFVLPQATLRIMPTFYFPCENGWIYVDGTEWITGEGENYFHGISTSILTLIPYAYATPTPTFTITPTRGSPNGIPFGAHPSPTL